MGNDNLKVLILCSYPSTYVIQLYTYIKKYHPNIKFSIYTRGSSAKFFSDKMELEEEENIYSFGEHDFLCVVEAKKLPQFDIIHCLWMEHFWGEAAPILKSKCNGWLASVGGSDLLRDSKNIWYRFWQKRIIRYADMISSEGEDIRRYFNEVYGTNKEHRIIRYGIDVLDYFEPYCHEEDYKMMIKEKYGISLNETVLMLGTNGRGQQQHKLILEAIKSLPASVINDLFLLIPMTYEGENEYINEITRLAMSITPKTKVLQRFLNPKEMAEIIAISDILVHVQISDQLSSIMLSHMYNGNIVVAGSWLPYSILREKGIIFWSIDKIDELGNFILNAIKQLSTYKLRCANNKDIISSMSKWEKASHNWYDAYISINHEKYEK